MTDIVIVAAARTPQGRLKGQLADVAVVSCVMKAATSVGICDSARKLL